MTTSSSKRDDERTRAASQIDAHFDITEFLLAHPEILAALPNGTELDVASPEAVWLRLPSMVQSSGNVVSGSTPRHTTISGTTIDGASDRAHPAIHGGAVP